MNIDTVSALVGLPVTLTIPAAAIVASWRRARPYKVVGHNPATGMVAVRWRNQPDQTCWYTPSHLATEVVRRVGSDA